MKYLFMVAIMLYIVSVVCEVSLCLLLEANRYRYCDTMLVGTISAFIVATTILALAVVFRSFHIL